MTVDVQSAAAKAQAVIDQASSKEEAQLSRNSEIVSQKISFFDKLIILNGSTLAISFTAATGFHPHLQAAGRFLAYIDLFSAWRLLIISIIGSLVSNWLSMSYIANVTALMHLREAEYINLRVAAASQSLIPETKVVPLDTSPERQRSDRIKIRTYDVAFQAANFLGLISQGATFLSYISLYKFARTSLLNM